MTHFTKKRILALAACVSLASLLTACDAPSGGYYDANGNFVDTNTPYGISKSNHAPLPGGPRDGYYSERTDHRTYQYDRAGYYDSHGNYRPTYSELNVPEDMFPPRGLCRVWFAGRAIVDQPSVESCDGIRQRVPAGAYVIYGG